MGKKNKQRETETPSSDINKITEKPANGKVKKEKSKKKKNHLLKIKNETQLKSAAEELLAQTQIKKLAEDSTNGTIKKKKKKQSKQKMNQIEAEKEDKFNENSTDDTKSNLIMKEDPDSNEPDDSMSEKAEKKTPRHDSKLGKITNVIIKKNKKKKLKQNTDQIKAEKQDKLIENSVKDTKSSLIKEEDPNVDDQNDSISQKTEKKIPRHDSKPENTIFVGNLPPNTKKKQLESLFKQFGYIISIRFRTAEGKRMFKHSARLKADTLIAYVVFDNPISKEKALSLSGSEFKGRHIRVTAAKNFTSQIEKKVIIFVGNLKYSATEEKLHEIFSTCGSIEYVRTLRNDKGCSGVAYVCFKKPESVTLALELNNTLLDDRPMRVQRYRKNPEQIKSNTKELKGPARRLLEKKNKLSGKKGFKTEVDSSKSFKRENMKGKDLTRIKLKTPKKEKKSDYQGKKITDKKKSKDKKKKPTHLQKLARKIAPK